MKGDIKQAIFTTSSALGDHHPIITTKTHPKKKTTQMHHEVTLELLDETLIKLDKLASKLGLARDELINESMRELLNETESSGS
ncbi:MAG: hypothetical protein VKK63_03695 [Synechococcus sp.]|nr:hypothetical protein [Synechococcus sp.]